MSASAKKHGPPAIIVEMGSAVRWKRLGNHSGGSTTALVLLVEITGEGSPPLIDRRFYTKIEDAETSVELFAAWIAAQNSGTTNVLAAARLSVTTDSDAHRSTFTWVGDLPDQRSLTLAERTALGEALTAGGHIWQPS